MPAEPRASHERRDGHRESTLAVVLAAGGATRFKAPFHKLLAPLGGSTVAGAAVMAAVESGIGDVVVITGSADLSGELPVSVSVLHNARWTEGVASSLFLAVRAGRERGVDAIVVGLADQPFVAPSAWRSVAAVDETPIVVATYQGVRAHPVRLAAVVWDRLPRTGDSGARLLMAAHPELVTEVACKGEPADIDTVRDLQRWSPGPDRRRAEWS